MHPARSKIKWKLRLVPRLIALLSLLGWLATACFPTAPTAFTANPQVSAEKLRKFNLDRRLHKCLGVADGDTITLEQIGPVRFIGIDTPEKNHPLLPVQYMARESSEFTTARCLSREIRLDYDPNDDDFRDKYQRVLGYVYLKDGTFLQEELVRNGLAIAYTKYPLDESIKKRLLLLEKEARQKGLGLWRENGLGEVNWILDQKQPMIQVGWDGENEYELFFAGWRLNLSGPAGIGDKIAALHRRMYELSPADFEKESRSAGFQQKGGPTSHWSLLVFGMAHKKWGLYHKGLVRPRVPQSDLDDRLLACFALLKKKHNPGTRMAGFVGMGFRRVKELDYDPGNLVNATVPDSRISSWIHAPKTRIISWDQAGQHIERSVLVHGRIVRSHNSGKACFLNFHNNFTRYMGAVIFESDFQRFPARPETVYLGKYIAIRGKIKEYRNRPEIIVEDPSQITVLPE